MEILQRKRGYFALRWSKMFPCHVRWKHLDMARRQMMTADTQVLSGHLSTVDMWFGLSVYLVCILQLHDVLHALD